MSMKRRRQSQSSLKIEIGKRIGISCIYCVGYLDRWYLQPSKIRKHKMDPNGISHLLIFACFILFRGSKQLRVVYLLDAGKSVFLSCGFLVNCPKQRNRMCAFGGLLLLRNLEMGIKPSLYLHNKY